MIIYKIDVYIPEDYIDLLIKKLGDEKYYNNRKL